MAFPAAIYGMTKEGGMSEINCNNCAVSDFKESLCHRCAEMKRLGRAEDIEGLLIKAFSEVDSPAKSDCIERQAAIDAIVAWTVEDRPDVEMPTDLIDRIKALPTAQPELNEWCHDCKEYDKEHHCCPRWNRVIRTTLEEAQPDKTYEQGWKDGREALRKEIWEDERDSLD